MAWHGEGNPEQQCISFDRIRNRTVKKISATEIACCYRNRTACVRPRVLTALIVVCSRVPVYYIYLQHRNSSTLAQPATFFQTSWLQDYYLLAILLCGFKDLTIIVSWRRQETNFTFTEKSTERCSRRCVVSSQQAVHGVHLRLHDPQRTRRGRVVVSHFMMIARQSATKLILK